MKGLLSKFTLKVDYFVIGPIRYSLPFAVVYVRIFEPGNCTGTGSERVKPHIA